MNSFKEKVVREIIRLGKKNHSLRMPALVLAALFLVIYHSVRNFFLEFRYHPVRQRILVGILVLVLLAGQIGIINVFAESEAGTTESNTDTEETFDGEESGREESNTDAEEASGGEESGQEESNTDTEEMSGEEESGSEDKGGGAEETDENGQEAAEESGNTEEITQESYTLAEGVSLPQITITVTGGDNERIAEPLITGWHFDAGDIFPKGELFYDEGVYRLVLAGGDEEVQIPFEEIASLLPEVVTVELTYDTASGEAEPKETVLSITGWDCAEYVEDEEGKLPYNGEFLLTAQLGAEEEEKEYAFSDGVEPVSVTLIFDAPMMTAAVTASPGVITSNQEWGAQTLDAGTYTINPGVTVTVTGQLTVSGDVIIEGGGKLVRGDASAYFTVSGGNLTLRNIEVDGASLSSSYTMIDVSGGQVTLGDGCRIHHCIKSSSQGAVLCLNGNGSSAVFLDAVIENCQATSYGGAIYMAGGSSLTISGGIYRENSTATTSSYGGGFIYNRASKVEIYGGSFIGNTSQGRGGCIYNTGVKNTKTYLYGGYFQGNRSTYTGYTGSGAVFYSSENPDDTVINLSGNVQFCGDGVVGSGTDGVFLDLKSNTGRKAQISSELKYPLALYLAAEEGRVIAEGVDGYQLQKKDMKKITFTDTGTSGTVWYAKLDEEHNHIVLTTTNPGYSLYVTYAVNGGKGDVSDGSEYSSGDTVTVQSGDSLQRDGYSFDGWNTKPDGTGTAYQAGAAFQITDDVTLYAQWISVISVYTVTYKTNGGTIANESSYTSYTHGTGLTLPTPTRTGYTFGGWYESSNFTDSAVTSISASTAENKTFYAKWTANNYTVTFDYQGATGGSSTAEKIVTYDSVYGALPTPEKTGYTFKGWYTQAGGQGRQVTAQTTVATANAHKLFAYWKDETPPVVTITLPDTPAPNANGWYSESFEITVRVTDDKDESGTVLSGGIAGITWKDGENGAEQTVSGLSGNAPVYEKEFTIRAADGTHTYYVNAVDNAGNESGWKTVTVSLDTGNPVFSGRLSVANRTKEGADITFTPSEGGKVYWIVDDTGAAPSAQEVKGQSGQKGGVQNAAGGTTGSFTITGLTSGEKHNVYVVLEDAAGNLSEVKQLSFTTLQAAPEITLNVLDIDPEKETVKLPEGFGEAEVYTNPADPSGSKILPEADGSLPVEPGTSVYIRYPEKTDGGETTPASDSTEIKIPNRPAAPAPKQAAVTDTAVTVTNPVTEEEYVLVKKGQTPDWNNSNTTGEFTGLDPNEEYDLYVRKKATEDSFASEPVKTEVRTSVEIKKPVTDGSGGNGSDGSSGGSTPEDNSDSDTPAVTPPPVTPSADTQQPASGTEGSPDKVTETQPTQQPEGLPEQGAEQENTDTDTQEQDSSDSAQTDNNHTENEAVQTVQAKVADGRIVISGGNGFGGGSSAGSGNLADGERIATGNVQGMAGVGSVPKTSTLLALGDGAVIVTVVCEQQECTAGVTDTVSVANAVLEPEQIQLANDGKTIEVRIDVKDISETVTGQDKEVIESALTECWKEMPELTLGMYVDISMFIRIGEGDWDAVTATKEPIEVIIGIPEELMEDGREFYIIRAHEGEYTLLNDMDNDSDTITISTDRFSAYAIAYRQTDEAGENHKCGLCHICPTFLGICYFIWLAVIIAAILMIVLIVMRKRGEKEQQS